MTTICYRWAVEKDRWQLLTLPWGHGACVATVRDELLKGIRRRDMTIEVYDASGAPLPDETPLTMGQRVVARRCPSRREAPIVVPQVTRRK